MSQDAFSSLAERYDSWYATPVGAWADRLETEAVFRLLALRPGERLLELGTGTGRYAAEAARRGANVVAVDISPAMLEIARSRTSDLRVALVRADISDLPFADGSFDAVLAVTSLCFTSEPAPVLGAAVRVLRPGGRLIIGELNRWSFWAMLRRLETFVRPTTYRAAHFRGYRELHAMLVATGLELEHWEGVLHLPPVNRAMFLNALDPFERFGQRQCPMLGAFLAIGARRPLTRSPATSAPY